MSTFFYAHKSKQKMFYLNRQQDSMQTSPPIEKLKFKLDWHNSKTRTSVCTCTYIHKSLFKLLLKSNEFKKFSSEAWDSRTLLLLRMFEKNPLTPCSSGSQCHANEPSRSANQLNQYAFSNLFPSHLKSSMVNHQSLTRRHGTLD